MADSKENYFTQFVLGNKKVAATVTDVPGCVFRDQIQMKKIS